MKYDAFLFDCDGVLLDSNEIKIAALEEALIINGHEPSFIDWACREFRGNFGRTRPEHFKVLADHWKRMGNPVRDFTKEHASYSLLVERYYSDSDVIRENVEIMQFLRKEGRRVFIVSASDEDGLKQVIGRKIGKEICPLVRGGPVKKVDHIKKLISEYSFQCPVLFGDSKQDLNAARECGIDFIGLSKYSAEPLIFKEYCLTYNFECFDHLNRAVIS